MHFLKHALIGPILLLFSQVFAANPPALDQWYGISALSLAGGGLFYSGEDERFNPAGLAGQNRGFETTALNYPDGIHAFRSAWYPGEGHRLSAMSFRFLDYGRFSGYDEQGNATSDFGAYETWIQAATSGISPSGQTSWGISSGYMTSSIENVSFSAVMVTASAMIRLDSSQTRIGLAVQNLGWLQESTSQGALNRRVEITVCRSLKHLPLDLYVDGRMESGTYQVGLGGVFQVAPNFQFLIGTSSNRMDQSLQQGQFRDLLSDTGLGFSFKHQQMQISAGGYFYGPGGWAQGIGIKWNI